MADFEQFTCEGIPWDDESPPREFDGDRAVESLAGTLAAMFAAIGDNFGVGLIANAQHRLERWAWESGKLWKYRWLLTVSPTLFALYQKQDQSEVDFQDYSDRDDFVGRARRLGGPLMEYIHSTDIVVAPALSNDPQWREQAKKYLAGAGINNQGNVYLTDRPKIVHDELFFRTISEQYVYEALLRRGLPFMPLPVVVKANTMKRPISGVNVRIEPDFCVIFKGRLVVLEIDGGSHNHKTAAEEEDRLRFLKEQGVIVRHIAADKCSDIEWATLTISDIFKSLDLEITRGRA